MKTSKMATGRGHATGGGRRDGPGRHGARVAVATMVLAALAAALLVATPAARAQRDVAAARGAAEGPKALAKATPEQLKAAYLHCNRLALKGSLDSGTATRCSVIYETLKERVFGGDFERLLAWSRTQPLAPPPPR